MGGLYSFIFILCGHNCRICGHGKGVGSVRTSGLDFFARITFLRRNNDLSELLCASGITRDGLLGSDRDLLACRIALMIAFQFAVVCSEAVVFDPVGFQPYITSRHHNVSKICLFVTLLTGNRTIRKVCRVLGLFPLAKNITDIKGVSCRSSSLNCNGFAGSKIFCAIVVLIKRAINIDLMHLCPVSGQGRVFGNVQGKNFVFRVSFRPTREMIMLTRCNGLDGQFFAVFHLISSSAVRARGIAQLRGALCIRVSLGVLQGKSMGGRLSLPAKLNFQIIILFAFLLRVVGYLPVTALFAHMINRILTGHVQRLGLTCIKSLAAAVRIGNQNCTSAVIQYQLTFTCNSNIHIAMVNHSIVADCTILRISFNSHTIGTGHTQLIGNRRTIRALQRHTAAADIKGCITKDRTQHFHAACFCGQIALHCKVCLICIAIMVILNFQSTAAGDISPILQSSLIVLVLFNGDIADIFHRQMRFHGIVATTCNSNILCSVCASDAGDFQILLTSECSFEYKALVIRHGRIT